MPVIEGAQRYYGTGNIVTSGVSEVQTLTISAASGSTFALKYDYLTSALISWTSSDATLVGAIDAALEGIATIGTGGVVTASATLSSGVGTITITFSGANLAGGPVSTLVPTSVTISGANATVAVAKTTTGVVGSFRGAAVGALAVFSTGAASKVYINQGSAVNPNWVSVGSLT